MSRMGKRRTSGASRLRQDDGSVIIIVMMFIIVLLGLGLAIFFITKSAMTGTETERKEVKAFNVAEAGVDAGMLALKMDWPEQTGEVATVSAADFRGEFPTADFRDPTRTGAPPFIGVAVYDDSQAGDGTPYAYDQNRNGLMWVDSAANVDNDRHRILVLAKRHTWELRFPLIAMYADTVGANGSGMRVAVDPDPGHTDPLPVPVEDPPGSGVFTLAAPAFYNGTTAKGVDLHTGIAGNPHNPGEFDDWIDAALMGAIKGIAQANGTYFTDAAAAQDFLTNGNTAGAIMYVEETTAVELAGNTQIGTRAKPAVLIIDTPAGSNNSLDFRGTADFFGIVVVKENVQVRGTTSFWGSFICSGTMTSNGNGASPEVNYNGNIIRAINGLHTISVNIVPNTWEEYTVATP